MRQTLLKALKRAVQSLVFLAGLVIFVALLLVGTETGSSWLIRQLLKTVEVNTGLVINLAEIEGTLVGELDFRNLDIRDGTGTMEFSAGMLGIQWSPLALLDSTLKINRLQLEKVDYRAAASTDSSDTGMNDMLGGLFSLPLSIELDQVNVKALTINSGQQITVADINMALSLNHQALHLETTFLEDASSATLNLTLSAGDYDVSGQVNWQSVINGLSAAGILTLSGDLSSLVVRHELQAPAAVMSAGTIETELFNQTGLVFDLRHQFQDISGAEISLSGIDSLSGSLLTSGTLTETTLAADMAFQVPGLETVQLDVQGRYGADGFTVSRLEINNERFIFTGAGKAVLSPLDITLEWTLDNFNDGDLLPDIALDNMDSNGTLQITGQGDDLVSRFSIAAVSGLLNGYAVSGSGDVSLRNNDIEDIALQLLSAENSLDVSGRISPALDINWVVQAPALDRLLPALQGEITGQGTLTGRPAAPQIAGDLRANSLLWEAEDGQFGAALVQATASYDGSDNHVRLAFVDVTAGNADSSLALESGEMELSGILHEHRFRIDTVSDQLALQLEGTGAYLDNSWQSDFVSARINSGYGDWRLTAPLSLTAAPGQVNVNQHCWAMADISLCTGLLWLEESGLAGNLELSDFPLAMLNTRQLEEAGFNEFADQIMAKPPGLRDLQRDLALVLPRNSFIAGMLDLEMDFTGFNGGLAGTELGLVLSPRDLELGILRSPGPDAESSDLVPERYGLDEVQLAVTRRNDQWQITSGFQVYLAGTDGAGFQGDFGSELGLDDAGNLSGEFELDFSNITWIEALVPTMRNPAGELDARGEITGNLE